MSLRLDCRGVDEGELEDKVLADFATEPIPDGILDLDTKKDADDKVVPLFNTMFVVLNMHAHVCMFSYFALYGYPMIDMSHVTCANVDN
nr:hypothetical protein CFP56_05864 [Quercus suber]